MALSLQLDIWKVTKRDIRSEKVMETAVGDDKVGRFFLHQPCYHFRCQTSSVNGTPHMSVSVADLLWTAAYEIKPNYGSYNYNVVV